MGRLSKAYSVNALLIVKDVDCCANLQTDLVITRFQLKVQVRSCQVNSGQVRSGQIRSCQVLSGQVW